MTYQRSRLLRPLKEISSCGRFRAYMLSALILSRHSYSAMLLAEQQIHQRSVQLGPLVLESDPLKFLAPTTDRDRTVSRRSEPSSRATLMGEQPNPWDLLQPHVKLRLQRHGKKGKPFYWIVAAQKRKTICSSTKKRRPCHH